MISLPIVFHPLYDLKMSQTSRFPIQKYSQLKKKLESKNILTRYVYPPLNSQRIYKQIKGLPISNDYCKNGLWLPSSLDIKMTQIDKISSMINKFYK